MFEMANEKATDGDDTERDMKFAKIDKLLQKRLGDMGIRNLARDDQMKKPLR
jgi:hypothetical protein